MITQFETELRIVGINGFDELRSAELLALVSYIISNPGDAEIREDAILRERDRTERGMMALSALPRRRGSHIRTM